MEKQKAHTIIINLKYLLQRGMKNLPDGSYSVSDIQNYFEYILKKTVKMLIIHQLEYI